MTRPNPFERELDRNLANYTPLSPLSLIARAACTYPRQLAVVHGAGRGALLRVVAHGIRPG